MHLNKKLSSLKSVDIDMCESCILEKQRRVNFKKVGRTPKEAKLELVHIDVWGPALVSAIRRRSYFVTFIDDHSRKVLVYFMRHKFEVFNIFKRWKAMVENETSMRIKKLWSDNGWEYKDFEFKKFYYENGTKLEKTMLGTSHYNGIPKKMNRTLIEKLEAYVYR